MSNSANVHKLCTCDAKENRQANAQLTHIIHQNNWPFYLGWGTLCALGIWPRSLKLTWHEYRLSGKVWNISLKQYAKKSKQMLSYNHFQTQNNDNLQWTHYFLLISRFSLQEQTSEQTKCLHPDYNAHHYTDQHLLCKSNQFSVHV